METTTRTPQFYRIRKALLALPLIVVPMVTVAFWNLHHTPKNQLLAQSESHGLNTSLPGAQFDKHQKAGNKMTFYDQAKQDSARVKANDNNPLVKQFGFVPPDKTIASTTPLTTAYADPNVTRINQKLAAINQQINQPQPALTPLAVNKPAADKTLTEQVSKLETMMKTINSSPGSDPQMQQLSKMLEQIQQIQHPETAKPDNKAVTSADNAFKAIPAIIDGNQKVLEGGAVRLRLNNSINIKGQVIPKGTLIFGTANITNQRLLLEIKNIRLDDAIIPVNLTVYSMDSMPGIPAPEAELAGAAGDGANNAVESMQFLSMDQSLATQAAAGGITAAKSLLSKKVRRIKVKLKNGYPILLRDNNQKG